MLKRNIEIRKEARKDAITRQVMEEEAGEDQFFTVKVKLQGKKTAYKDFTTFDDV